MSICFRLSNRERSACLLKQRTCKRRESGAQQQLQENAAKDPPHCFRLREYGEGAPLTSGMGGKSYISDIQDMYCIQNSICMIQRKSFCNNKVIFLRRKKWQEEVDLQAECPAT